MEVMLQQIEVSRVHNGVEWARVAYLINFDIKCQLKIIQLTNQLKLRLFYKQHCDL